MPIYLEQVLLIVAVAAFVFYFSIRARKYIDYLKETKLRGFGASLIILGILLFVITYLQLIPTANSSFIAEVSIWGVLIGAVLILVDWVLQKLEKRRLLSLEEERLDYITRVRKGIKIEDAEKIAMDKIKKETGKEVSIIASEKTFKEWIVYLKDKVGNKYKVALDIEGEIIDWEALDELPGYLTGAQ